MAKAKIVLFKSKTLKDGSHPIMLRITHLKKIKYVYLNFAVKPEEWLEETQTITTKDKKLKRVYNVQNLNFHRTYIEALEIISDLEGQNKVFSVDQIFEKLKGADSSTFKVFVQKIIDELEEQGKFGNATCYKRVQSVFLKFRNDKDISFDQIDYSTLKKFETYMLKTFSE